MIEVTVIMNILRSIAAPPEVEGIPSGMLNEVARYLRTTRHGVFALITRWKRVAKHRRPPSKY